MALPAAKKRYTVEEYLRLEEQAVDRHEFHDGEILAMSGGSVFHGRVALNVMGELRARLKGTPCAAQGSDVRVLIPAWSRYVYPDGSVVCGEPQHDPADASRGTLVNPRVIVEVLSPSTEGYDRGRKFEGYRTIASLQAYVLIAQDRPTVDVYARQADGVWTLSTTSGLGTVARVTAIGVELPLAEVYATVTFPADDGSAHAHLTPA